MVFDGSIDTNLNDTLQHEFLSGFRDQKGQGWQQALKVSSEILFAVFGFFENIVYNFVNMLLAPLRSHLVVMFSQGGTIAPVGRLESPPSKNCM